MKHIILTLLVAAVISACASDVRGPSDDAALERRLQHTWATTPDDVVIDGETSYLPGGVMNLFGHVREDGKVRTILASGTWHISKGYLYYTMTKSNFANLIPNGFTSVDKIVRITDDEFTYIASADGKSETERRIR
jgi:hypothetical protein